MYTQQFAAQFTSTKTQIRNLASLNEAWSQRILGGDVYKRRPPIGAVIQIRSLGEGREGHVKVPRRAKTFYFKISQLLDSGPSSVCSTAFTTQVPKILYPIACLPVSSTAIGSQLTPPCFGAQPFHVGTFGSRPRLYAPCTGRPTPPAARER